MAYFPCAYLTGREAGLNHAVVERLKLATLCLELYTTNTDLNSLLLILTPAYELMVVRDILLTIISFTIDLITHHVLESISISTIEFRTQRGQPASSALSFAPPPPLYFYMGTLG